jgi:signal transduction histidine kinase
MPADLLDEWRQKLAHDLRNPLTLAMGSLRLLQELGAGHTYSATDAELIKIGLRNCERLEAVIEESLKAPRGAPYAQTTKRTE